MKQYLRLFFCLAFLGAGIAYAQPVPDDNAVIAAVNSGNAGTVDVSSLSGYSSVYAVSDVHGMYDHLVSLLRANGLIDRDLNWTGGRVLFVVDGDSINKGSESVKVLDLWMSLSGQIKKAGGDFYHLLGNHEAELLDDPTGIKFQALKEELKEKKISMKELTDASYPRGRFLRSMPLALKAGRWLFCHGGLYPDVAWPVFTQSAVAALGTGQYGSAFITGDDSILEAKDWWSSSDTLKEEADRLTKYGFFGEVFGHMPKAFNVSGDIAAAYGGRFIKIDNGMAPEAGSNPGHLLVFESPSKMTEDAFPAVFSLSSSGEKKPVEIRQF